VKLKGAVVPGFVALQDNGGGGVLFNNQPDLDAIRTICQAHARFGTTALLPTLITDSTEVTERALDAGAEAVRQGTAGFLGLHLEGPHLSIARKGAHDPSLIRPMMADDLARLIDAKERVQNLMVTVAPETVAPSQIAQLVAARIVVSVGHSNADSACVEAAFAAGASQATHLFNAMSQLQNREPGVVGAVLANDDVFAGLIADGIHVHKMSVQVALAAKRGRGRIFLVSDAMSQTGTDIKSFELNGRTIHRIDGALRLDNGTLAGADLDMAKAIQFVHQQVGLEWDECLRMASLYPSQAIGVDDQHGHLQDGAYANFAELDADMTVKSTWIRGVAVHG